MISDLFLKAGLAYFDPQWPVLTLGLICHCASFRNQREPGKIQKVWTLYQIGPAIGFCSLCHPVISSGSCRSLNRFAANAGRF